MGKMHWILISGTLVTSVLLSSIPSRSVHCVDRFQGRFVDLASYTLYSFFEYTQCLFFLLHYTVQIDAIGSWFTLYYVAILQFSD